MRPLLQIRQWLLVLGTASILSACSSQPTLPTFSASGFIADEGVIRLWRLNDPQNEPQVLMVVYSPYQDQNTSVTFFEYRHGQLWQVRSQILNAGEQQIQEQLRFNRNNDVIFMQRETSSQKTVLSSDDITRWRFEANRILDISTALVVGDIKLYQGYWQQGKIETCDGEIRKVSFEPYAENWIKQRERESRGQKQNKLTIAWLEAPEGNQLLMVANDNFCKWQPTEKSL
ncbi:DUF1481 domain-containing protein [Moellerella wisconsensis]|uniref:DUF1481 domain-containing protein n=2 Tax=Moellerella wisconsensis TaxID=158849 RepID=A0A9Q8V3K6_9GAMM|nr:DUF1481 domain-containing protein [Moellerella wisconsensis]UNH24447.1 DUF1481 domain-containing protein [Moellerella wisconsensis]UNH31025.1 DUF1481 domain-containing protein [Moellerella wisconsensis]UNH39170.1 DUF1481 domain-containing protein [Moellerella wisconsensis]WJW82158.1 DUF1481 domain-containing protein [Moellerella wisconsensis]